MYYQQIKEDTGMIVLVYPDSQREDINIFLRPNKFKKPLDLIGTHVVTAEYAWQTKEQSMVREFIVPQRVEAIEVIDRNLDTEHHFTQLVETYSKYLRDTKFIQIVKLYCVFDEAIANTPALSLIVEERIGKNYINDSETSSA